MYMLSVSGTWYVSHLSSCVFFNTQSLSVKYLIKSPSTLLSTSWDLWRTIVTVAPTMAPTMREKETQQETIVTVHRTTSSVNARIVRETFVISSVPAQGKRGHLLRGGEWNCLSAQKGRLLMNCLSSSKQKQQHGYDLSSPLPLVLPLGNVCLHCYVLSVEREGERSAVGNAFLFWYTRYTCVIEWWRERGRHANANEVARVKKIK